jgi:hypothetical protein
MGDVISLVAYTRRVERRLELLVTAVEARTDRLFSENEAYRRAVERKRLRRAQSMKLY